MPIEINITKADLNKLSMRVASSIHNEYDLIIDGMPNVLGLDDDQFRSLMRACAQGAGDAVRHNVKPTKE
jgi:hypothetical protein